MKDLISIIIPVYNAENTLERCLDSVLAQTHKDIEVICVEDGSIDGSANILSRYKEMDQRVKVISPISECETDDVRVPNNEANAKKGGGPATARNAGLEEATGAYIGFVDADDFIDPDMYERLLAVMQEGVVNDDQSEVKHGGTPGKQAELANCGRISFFDDGSEKIIPPEMTEEFVVENADALGQLIVGVPDFIWDKLYDAKIIKREGIKFPDGRVYGEDTVFLIKYLCHVNKVVFLDEPLYHYNAHSEGSITNTISDSWYDIFENLKDILYYFREQLDDRGYEIIKPYLEDLCIKYYDRRANAMIRYDEKKFQIRYVKYSFEFLTENFPDWKKRMKSMFGIVFPKVKTNYLLMRLYILAPGSVKGRFADRVPR